MTYYSWLTDQRALGVFGAHFSGPTQALITGVWENIMKTYSVHGALRVLERRYGL